MKQLLLLFVTACVSTRTPVSPTTPDLAARRAQMIAWLHDYAAAGVFPRDDAGRPLSVFRDTHGVRCPMAELIDRSGHADLVDQVAATRITTFGSPTFIRARCTRGSSHRASRRRRSS